MFLHILLLLKETDQTDGLAGAGTGTGGLAASRCRNIGTPGKSVGIKEDPGNLQEYRNTWEIRRNIETPGKSAGI